MQRIADNDAEFVAPHDILAELRDDNRRRTSSIRREHDVCAGHGDIAITSLLEVWIDETEQRIWFLHEARHGLSGTNH
jgi:starvation-inducible DNA-binding protein